MTDSGLAHDKIPHIDHHGGGRGVQAQRTSVPGDLANDKIPWVNTKAGGRGVQAQRDNPGGLAKEKIPLVNMGGGGIGVQVQRQTMPTRLSAPFPWHGGKSRWAADIVRRFGDIEVYAEPFAGSLAVLLASPKRRREIVCDKDGMICNAFRAIQHDPDAVARWADYPTIHQDLTSRRHWLADWRDANADLLSVDPLAYSAQAAGWWIWCLSSWIGGSGDMLRRRTDTRPYVADRGGGGQGVQAQRVNVPGGGLASDKRPSVHDCSSGRGVQVQRSGNARPDQIPHVNSNSGGRGVVQAQRQTMPDQRAVKAGLPDGTVNAQSEAAGRPYRNRRPPARLDARSG